MSLIFSMMKKNAIIFLSLFTISITTASAQAFHYRFSALWERPAEPQGYITEPKKGSGKATIPFKDQFKDQIISILWQYEENENEYKFLFYKIVDFRSDQSFVYFNVLPCDKGDVTRVLQHLQMEVNEANTEEILKYLWTKDKVYMLRLKEDEFEIVISRIDIGIYLKQWQYVEAYGEEYKDKQISKRIYALKNISEDANPFALIMELVKAYESIRE